MRKKHIRRTAVSAVFLNQVQQALQRFFFGNVLFDAKLAFVEANPASACPHITVVGIGHFARTVYDTAHYGNLEAFQMRGAGFYFGQGALKMVCASRQEACRQSASR